MSVLGLNKVQKRIIKNKLIDGLGKRDLETPEGVGRDLRLGAIYKIKPGSKPLIEADGESQGKRRGSEIIEVARFNPDKKKQSFVKIKPGDFYLIETFEEVNTPTDLMPYIFARSTLQRNGLFLKTTKVDPGYKGKLICGLKNEGPVTVTLQMGARICNVVFFEVKGLSIAYRGQHQGGRVNSPKAEKQV